jgi:MtaA/CmuA family methyltransferase
MTASSHRTTMSPKRRFLTALLGGQPDRIPVGNVVSTITVDLMRASGAWFPLAHQEPECMAALAATGHEILGFDTVMPVFSVTQESAALGCEVDWGRSDMMPGVRTHPFAGHERFELPSGWLESPPIQTVLRAIELLRKRCGDRVVIVGKVMGPWTLSYQMMGVEDFLIDTIENPTHARRCLESLTSVPVAFAQAQMRAGADIICLADHATGGMVSPETYRTMLLPIHQEIVPQMGGPVVLHCCGNTTDRVHLFAQTGVDAYHFESQVDMKQAVAAARGKMRLMGNVNNPHVLLGGTPADVTQACRRAISAGVQILSPECAVPLTTPVKNLRAIVESVA